MRTYEHLVVGGGPGGLAAVISLFDHGVSDILWIDPTFSGGRLNTLYREISSPESMPSLRIIRSLSLGSGVVAESRNTKVGIYLDGFRASRTAWKLIQSTPEPNAVTKLLEFDKEDTCQLSYAGDVVMLLIDRLDSLGVNKIKSTVGSLDFKGDTWTAKLADGREITTRSVVLATGSHPRVPSWHKPHNPNLKVLDLDSVLRKSHIPDLFGIPTDNASVNDNRQDNTHHGGNDIKIGIIGNSHSGILAVWNLYSVLPRAHLVLFERHPIVYAVYTDHGVIHDNTGLKGATAAWSKETLDCKNPGQGRVERVRLSSSAEGVERVYHEKLPLCTHMVYAVGYERSAIPLIRVDGCRVDEGMVFDMHTSGFHLDDSTRGSKGTERADTHPGRSTREGDDEEHGTIFQDKSFVPRLHGCGIAFPEEVEDPEGNVEAAVGVAKFFKFAERVSQHWVDESR